MKATANPPLNSDAQTAASSPLFVCRLAAFCSPFDLRVPFSDSRYPSGRTAMARMRRAESTERLFINAKKGDKQWATVTGKKGNRRNRSSRRNLRLQFVLATPDRNNKKCGIEQRRGFASHRLGTAPHREYSGDLTHPVQA